MPDFVPIDDYVTDGFAPSGVHSPWATEPLSTLRPGDEARFRLLDAYVQARLQTVGAGEAARPSFLYIVLSTAFGGKAATA